MLMLATAVPAVGFFEITTKVNSAQANANFVPGEFIVKFRPEVIVEPSESLDGVFITGVASIDALNEKHHVFFGERVFDSFTHLARDNLDLYNVFNFHIPEGANILSLIEEYSSDPHVSYAEPNYLIHSCVIPNDPSFSLQYALHNTGQTGGTPDADIDAPEAWDIETGDENIVIAVIDSGVEYTHPDLAGNIWVNPGEDLNGNGVVDPSDFNGIDDDSNGFIDDLRGWDFVDCDVPPYPGEDGSVRDNDPMDVAAGHGTFCSGIVGAVTNNNMGIAGVCWNCPIMPIRVFYLSSDGDYYGEADDMAPGVVYAADNGARILSMSIGIIENSQLFKDAVNYAYAQGAILFASAGNWDVNQEIYPASYDCVIAVGATDYNDERVDHSDWGSCHGSWVDVAAPGSDIYSTYPGHSYTYGSGTSAACPFVAGVAGLMLSQNSGLTQDEVRTILRSTTDPVDSEFYVGTGRINAYQALQRDTSPIVSLNSTIDDAHVSGVVPITGTANGATFVNYSVWYGIGAYPDTWTELYTSTTPVTNDILTTWDTTSLVEDETYSIRLLVYDTGGYISKDQAVVLVDNQPNKGWTLQWTHSYAGPRTAQSQPIGDIDEDGINEVFISSSYEFTYKGGICRILSYDETQATYIEEYSWTVDAPNYWRHPFGVTVIDLNDDGDLEFCLAWGDTYADGIYAYDWDGTTLTQLDYYNGIGFDFSYSVSASDYDDDGDVELVCANDPHWYSGTKHVTALGWDNVNDEFVEEAFWALPGHLNKGCWETVSGDTDNDGKTEVITTISDWDSAQTAGTWALNWNEDTGQWQHEPVSTNYPIAAPCGLALGDLNGNGIPEIGVGSGNWYNGEAVAWLYEWNGTAYEEVWHQEYPDEPDIFNAIEIGDADNDGTNELCVGTDIVHIYQWDGVEYIEEATLTESRHRLSSLNIGDCDSDGLNEIKTGERALYPPGNIGSEFIYKYIGRKPYADFSWTPSNPGPNQPITFDASTSHDPDGTIILYEWDWDTDGVYDEAQSSPTTTHAWATIGSYPVRLRVTDNENATGIIIKTVNVSGIPLKIDINGGIGVKVVITNNGTSNVAGVPWQIHVKGGILGRINKTVNGTLDIPAGESRTVKSGMLFGFGAISIAVKVADEEKTAKGTQILIFSMVKK